MQVCRLSFSEIVLVTRLSKARKSLVAIIKTATGKSRKFKISFKSKTKEKVNDDDFLWKHIQSAELTSINLSAISSSCQSDILSDKGHEHGQSPDSQETITDELSSSETYVTRISKTLIQMIYMHQKAFVKFRIF